MRFAAAPGTPLCKENEMAWCRTDLTATVYDWKKLVGSGLRFGVMDPKGVAADAQMAAAALRLKWKASSTEACSRRLLFSCTKLLQCRL